MMIMMIMKSRKRIYIHDVLYRWAEMIAKRAELSPSITLHSRVKFYAVIMKIVHTTAEQA